jgi:tetratricopeptide (TPR) repeat protein
MSDTNGNGKSAIDLSEYKRRMPAAVRRCERAVKKHPDSASSWFELGRALMNAGRNQQAESAFREALSRAPDSANYLYYLGEALGKCGKFSEAAQVFKFLADIDPKLEDPMSTIGVSALRDLAYCLGEMGEWKHAFTTLQPAGNVALNIIGDLANFQGNAKEYDHACYLYSIALLLAPDDAELHYGAGRCHREAGRLPEALAHLRKARRADPRDPDIWYDLGLTLAMMKKGKLARACFRKVLQLDSKYFWAWYDLACLDALEKRPDSAFRKLYKSVECGFQNADYLLKDADFKSIRKDPRWRMVLDCISDKAKIEKRDTD